MLWKSELQFFEEKKDWESAIGLILEVIKDNPNDFKAYISINYLLMNVLVEEQLENNKHDFYAALLKKTFQESYFKFSENPEYLFYTGITAHLSEWYLGISIEEARGMLEKAFLIEPDNLLFKWGHLEYINQGTSTRKEERVTCIKEILKEKSYTDKLKIEGSVGEYILEIMQYLLNKSLK